MATRDEYATAANAILKVLDDYVNEYVPDIFGQRQKALNAMPGVAGACAKVGVDALEAFRAKHTTQQPNPKERHP
jgi:hypothetical protein